MWLLSRNTLAIVKSELEKLIANYSCVSGKKYTDFASSQDRVATVGLGALIAGGVGATAAKTRIILPIILVLLAFLKKLLIFLIVGLGFLKS
ncbi:hypothetical protein C7B70_00670 [Chlorogloea sp. CCALA 695]|nr:hypothetical protein C7B70_00670 [Chlorogloea sp. CCALA 695]